MNLVNSINQCREWGENQPVFYFSWHVRPLSLSSTPTSSIFLYNDAQADHFIRARIKRLNEVITGLHQPHTGLFFFLFYVRAFD